MPIHTSRTSAGRASSRGPDEAMRIVDWIVPVGPVAMVLRSLSARVRALVGLSAIVFVGGLAAAIFLSNSASRHAAERAANHFATALVHDDPRTAPPGAQSYVAGVRTYFGSVYSVDLLGAHNHGVDTTHSSHTFYQADLLLATRRGPTVIELAFENHSLTSQRVTSIYELRPSDAPGLSDAQRHALDVAFKARGGTAATATTLNGDLTSSATTVDIVTRAMNQLHCVQRARGDVAMMQACSQG